MIKLYFGILGGKAGQTIKINLKTHGNQFIIKNDQKRKFWWFSTVSQFTIAFLKRKKCVTLAELENSMFFKDLYEGSFGNLLIF